ncbi:UNVERIFIED_CONTAM: hypothetical protein RMT77_013693 [Armadillidium vulgare]
MLMLKPFALIFLLCLSVCEKSRIKRVPQGIIPSVLDIICRCPKPPTCPEPPTCPVTPTSPEPLTYPELSTCSEPPTCPETTTSSETSTFPETPTCPACPDNNTCPISPQELCSGAYYCDVYSMCITTRFAAKNAYAAIDKCSSFSNENVTFEILFSLGIGAIGSELAKCLSAALPASGIYSNETFWMINRNNFGQYECRVFSLETDGEDQVIGRSPSTQVPCTETEEHPFFCLAILQL